MAVAQIKIQPSDLSGTPRIPLSKSLLHRAQICAYLAGDPALADLGDGPMSVDIRATGDCLAKLFDSSATEGECILDCHESGSTLRFLVPLAAALGRRSRFVGEGRLPTRPLDEYAGLFCGRGVTLRFPRDGRFLPLTLSGKLTPGTFRLPGNISSQYISGLLMALPLLSADSEIVLTTRLESEPYVALTVSVMAEFGVRVDRTANGYAVAGNQKYRRATPYQSETDFSQAAFWLVAQYLGQDVRLPGLPEVSTQGDAAIRSILHDLAARRKSASDKGVPEEAYVVDASQIPDLVPALSIACAATPGTVHITNAGRLRIKECDRLMATEEMLARFGIEVQSSEDELIIRGTSREGALFRATEILAYNDHRMVMAAAIAATRADGPVIIHDAHAVAKSYPDFFSEFRSIGGIADELNVGE